MQDVWEKFTEYKQKLFDKTSTINHPWVVLDSNDKKISGLNSIRYVLQNIPYTNKDEDVLNKDFPEAMTVLRPNINEQSVWDNYNKIASSLQSKGQTNSDSGGIVSDINKTIKSGLETAKKSLDKKSSNSSGDYATRCSSKGIEYIKKEEGFRPDAYTDTKNVWTIGYGQTVINGRAVKQGDKITEPEAYKALINFLENGTPAVKDSQGNIIRKAVPSIKSQILSLGGGHQKLEQNQFDALCSLMYNYGGYVNSDLKKTIQLNPNPQQNPEIKKHFTTKWKDPELKNRRDKEFLLYSIGDYVPYNA
jgi:GH24 family phage-related lysozyme (muramidase)